LIRFYGPGCYGIHTSDITNDNILDEYYGANMSREVKMVVLNLWLYMTAILIFTSCKFQTIRAGDSVPTIALICCSARTNTDIHDCPRYGHGYRFNKYTEMFVGWNL